MDASTRRGRCRGARARLVAAAAAGCVLHACQAGDGARGGGTAATATATATAVTPVTMTPTPTTTATATATARRGPGHDAAASGGGESADPFSAPGPSGGGERVFGGVGGGGDGGGGDGAGGGASTRAPSPIATAAPLPTPLPAVRPTRCEPPTQPEEYCLDVGARAPSQAPEPAQPFEANGCVAAAAVRNMCLGVHDVLSGPRRAGHRCCFTVCRGIAAPCAR
jgi:hypothetical protein